MTRITGKYASGSELTPVVATDQILWEGIDGRALITVPSVGQVETDLEEVIVGSKDILAKFRVEFADGRRQMLRRFFPISPFKEEPKSAVWNIVYGGVR